jgi:hypothetical protein
MCVTEEIEVGLCDLIVFVANDRIQKREFLNIGFWRERTEVQLSAVEMGAILLEQKKNSFKYPVCNRGNINYAFTLCAIQHWISRGSFSPHYHLFLYTFLLLLTFIFISLEYSKIKRWYFVNVIVTRAFIKYRQNVIHRVFVSLLLCFMLRPSCFMFCFRKSILSPKRRGLWRGIRVG